MQLIYPTPSMWRSQRHSHPWDSEGDRTQTQAFCHPSGPSVALLRVRPQPGLWADWQDSPPAPSFSAPEQPLLGPPRSTPGLSAVGWD